MLPEMNAPYDQLKETVSQSFRLYLTALPDVRVPNSVTCEPLSYDDGTEVIEIKRRDGDPVTDRELRSVTEALDREWKIVKGDEPMPSELWKTTSALRAACGYECQKNEDADEMLVTAATRLVETRDAWLDASRRVPDLHFDEQDQSVARLDGDHRLVILDNPNYFTLVKAVYECGPVPTHVLHKQLWPKEPIQQLYKEKDRLNKKLKPLGVKVTSSGYRNGYVVDVI